MEASIFIYQVFQISIILIFLVNVSDLRKKGAQKQLLNPKLIKIMKTTYFIPLVIFLLTVILMDVIFIKVIFSLILTLLGLIIVITSKSTLGKHHTWTGYGAYPESFVKSGIYSVVRHPMYLGIFVCIGGMLLFVIKHTSVLLWLVDVIGSVFIVFILSLSAKRETEHLRNLMGNDFEEYCRNVPGYLPRFFNR